MNAQKGVQRRLVTDKLNVESQVVYIVRCTV